MLTVEDVEIIRRSAAMAPLSSGEVDRLIAACAQMALERRQIAGVLAELPDSFAEVRAALNRLASLVR